MDWNLRPRDAHFRTPGPLGLSRGGKPLALHVSTDTLSQLLTQDPIGHNPWNEKVALEAFLRELKSTQISARSGRTPIWGLPDEKLKPVNNLKKMH